MTWAITATPATADKGGSFRNNDGLPAAPSTKQQTIADRKPPGQKTGGLNIDLKIWKRKVEKRKRKKQTGESGEEKSGNDCRQYA